MRTNILIVYYIFRRDRLAGCMCNKTCIKLSSWRRKAIKTVQFFFGLVKLKEHLRSQWETTPFNLGGGWTFGGSCEYRSISKNREKNIKLLPHNEKFCESTLNLLNLRWLGKLAANQKQSCFEAFIFVGLIKFWPDPTSMT